MLLEWLHALSRMLFMALHVVNSGSFPKPLSAAEERAYLVTFREKGDMAARNKLIEHNLRLVAHIIKKYYSATREQDDLISIGTIGLIKAVDSFDPARTSRFSTYAARCIENEILMNFRADRKNQNNVSIHEPIENGEDGLTYEDVVSDPRHMDEDVEDVQEAAQLRALVQRSLSGRDRQIIVLRYGFGGQPPMTQQQVAQLLGISRSYVSRLESRTLAQLREMLCR